MNRIRLTNSRRGWVCRGFLVALIAGVAFGLSACAGPPTGGTPMPNQARTPASAPAIPTSTAEAGTDPGGACQATPTAANPEGPFYQPGAPERGDLTEIGMEGTRLTLTGRVITGECEPIAGAELDFWQTDANGDYDNLGYTLRGRTFSDEQGRYQLVTILPGIYPGRPAHIHVKVTPPGGETLTTQIYFPGERFGDADRAVDPTLLAQWGDPADGGERATFDFVLSP